MKKTSETLLTMIVKSFMNLINMDFLQKNNSRLIHDLILLNIGTPDGYYNEYEPLMFSINS